MLAARGIVRVVAGACSLALMTGACSSSSKPYTGLTKPEFIKQANAICVNGQKRINAVGSSLGKSPTLDEVKRAYKTDLAPALQAELKALRALKPPANDRAKVSKFLGYLSKGIDQALNDVESAKSVTAIKNLDEPTPLQDADLLAGQYGISKCNRAS